MNLFLHGITDGHIAHGDTLARPAFLDADGGLQTFDVVLANPPYSIKAWNRDAFAKDPYGRNMWGVPPQGRADYAFFQHIAKSLDPQTGRAAILFPHGVLFRREEAALREALVKSDLIECVLGLGAGLFYNSPDGGRRRHPARHQARRAPGQGAVHQRRQRGRPRTGPVVPARVPPAEDPRRLPRLRATSTGFAAVATLDQIADKGYSLAIPLYVAGAKAADAGDQIDVADAVAEWRAAADAADQAVADVLALLRAGGDLVSLNLDKSTWTRVAFGDVVAQRQRTMRRPRDGWNRPRHREEHMDTGELQIHRWGDDRATAPDRRSHAAFKPGDVLFGKRRAYLRKVAYRRLRRHLLGDTTFVLEADDPAVLLPRVPALPRAVRRASSTTPLGTSAGSLSTRTSTGATSPTYEFDLPPLDEQKRIADLLWAVERASTCSTASRRAGDAQRMRLGSASLRECAEAADWSTRRRRARVRRRSADRSRAGLRRRRTSDRRTSRRWRARWPTCCRWTSHLAS